MSRIINGVVHYTSKEMAEKKGGSQQMWSHYARNGKVPAVKWIDENWYFNPEEVDQAAVTANQYAGRVDDTTR